jgi:hypothetical protein
MEIIPFIRFTTNTKYIPRWIYAGLILLIPFVDFFSIGYLSKSSRTLMLGSIGLPTWEKKGEIWMEGVKLLYIFILYEAIPFSLFSFSFFLIALHSFTAFFGHIIKYIGFITLFLCSFFIPFAFATFSEQMDFRKALEFERILKAIREVFVQYLGGYLCALAVIGICFFTIRRIPYLGVFLFSAITYYTLLIATYFFTQLYIKTSLSVGRIIEE